VSWERAYRNFGRRSIDQKQLKNRGHVLITEPKEKAVGNSRVATKVTVPEGKGRAAYHASYANLFRCFAERRIVPLTGGSCKERLQYKIPRDQRGIRGEEK